MTLPDSMSEMKVFMDASTLEEYVDLSIISFT
jgi:hypothetical protein